MGKRQFEVHSPDDRDTTQRSLGWFGVSAIAHIGLLIAVVLAPSFKNQMGEKAGTQAGETLEFKGDQITETSQANGGDVAPPSSQPTEVLLADANDASAVALPAAQAKPQVKVDEIKAATPVADVKPVEVKKPVITKSVKIAKTPKAAKAPTKAPTTETSAPPVAVTADGEVEINSALTDARKEETPDEPAKTETADTQEAKETKEEPPVAKAPVVAKKEEEAQPIEIALPESEALTAEQQEKLQAKPEAPASKIPANAKPIAQVESLPTQGTQSGTTQAGGTNHGAPLGSSNQNTGSATGGNQLSRGAGTQTAVPLGVPVRDARSLIAMKGNPQAEYPMQDRMAKREGTTVLIGRVTPAGAVTNVQLEKSSGSKSLDDSAAKAFSKWRYEPGQEGMVRLPVQFQLVGDAKELPTQLRRQ